MKRIILIILVGMVLFSCSKQKNPTGIVTEPTQIVVAATFTATNTVSVPIATLTATRTTVVVSTATATKTNTTVIIATSTRTSTRTATTTPTFTITQTPTNTPLPIEAFTDPNLKNFIITTIGKPADQITQADFDGVTIVVSHDSLIYDLDGIELLHNLKWLDIRNTVYPSNYTNRVTDYTPLLTLSKLEYLNISKQSAYCRIINGATVCSVINGVDLTPLWTLHYNYQKLSIVILDCADDLNPTVTNTIVANLTSDGCYVSNYCP